MNNYTDRFVPTDADIDRMTAHLDTTTPPPGKIASVLREYLRDGFSKARAVEVLAEGNLKRDMARGNGNAARRRIERLDDEAEARAIEQEFYESNRLSEADVDNLALEWEYRNRE